MRAVLEGVANPAWLLPVGEREAVLGRGARFLVRPGRVDLPSDTALSREHARLAFREGRPVLRATGACFVDGAPATGEVGLRDGARVRFGAHAFVVRFPAVPFTALPPLPWGPFAFGCPVHAGGMARLYAASHPVLGRDLLVKVPLRPDLGEALLTEGVIGLRCEHPNLLRPLFVGLLPNGSAAVALPRLAGDLVDRASVTGGLLAFEPLAALALDLLGALGHLHGKGLLHCDVKPANVLWDGARFLLSDLGIACVPGQRRPRAWLSPGFSAPEHENGETVVPASDLYMMGRTLRHVAGAGVPPGFRDWMGRLADPDPRHRPQDVAQARRLLEASR